MPGKLYIVPTPVGNLGDMTPRAIEVLKTVDKVGVGDKIGVRFADGSLTAKVDEVFTEKLDKANIA